MSALFRPLWERCVILDQSAESNIDGLPTSLVELYNLWYFSQVVNDTGITGKSAVLIS